MGNLGLTAVAVSTLSKKTVLDANFDILDLAQSDPATVDLTGGTASIATADFQQNFLFTVTNVPTGGGTVTVPNVARPFMVRSDPSNGVPFDLDKGTASIPIAPGETAWIVSGAGANDLFRVGVEGAAAGLVKSPYEIFEVGFDSSYGNAQNVPLWTSNNNFQAQEFPTIYRDDLGFDVSVQSDGVFQIPAAQGIRAVEFYFKCLATPLNNNVYRNELYTWRPVINNGAETPLFWENIGIGGNDMTVFVDHPVHSPINSPPISVIDGEQMRFRMGRQSQGTQAINPTVQGGDRCLIKVVEREVENGKPEPIKCYRNGTPSSAEVLLREPITRSLRIGDAFAGSYAYCGTNPSSTTVFDVMLSKGGITGKLGEISFSTGGVATFSFTETSVTLTNPGFETGDLTGWSTLHGSGGAVNTSAPRTGTYAFENGGFAYQGLYQDVAVPGDTTADDAALIDIWARRARLTWWNRRNSSGNGWAGYFRFFDDGGEDLESVVERYDMFPELEPSPFDTYVERTWTAKIPELTRSIRVGLEAVDGGLGAGYLDDISLDLITENLVLKQGHELEIVAPASLNGMADISITIAGTLA